MPSKNTTNTEKTAAPRRRPRERNLVLTGLWTLLGIFGFSVAVAQIPRFTTPSTTAYVCSTSIATSVGGIAPGSQVLVGGIPSGQVTSVNTVFDTRNGTPSEIEIHFDLDSTIPIRMDAVVRKYVGISGTNGSLNFDNLGTPASAFEEGQRRDLPLTAAASGPRAFIGARAASNTRKIQVLAEVFSKNLRNASTRTEDQIDTIEAYINILLQNIPHDIEDWKATVSRITSRIPEWSGKWNSIVKAFDLVQSALDPVRTFIRWARDEAAMSMAGSMNNLRLARSHTQDIRDDFLTLEKRIAQLQTLGTESITVGEETLEKIQELVPEARSSLQRAFARGTLAGGQLSRLQSSLLTTGITALMYTEDDASWNRRELLESVEDAIRGATALKQASIAIEGFTAAHPDALKQSPRLAELLADNVDAQIVELNQKLRTLYEFVLRQAP